MTTRDKYLNESINVRNSRGGLVGWITLAPRAGKVYYAASYLPSGRESDTAFVLGHGSSKTRAAAKANAKKLFSKPTSDFGKKLLGKK